MNRPSTHLPSVELIPTRSRPFQVQDRTAEAYRGMEEQIRQSGFADQFRFLELRDDKEMILISNEFTWLTLDEVIQLAEGCDLRTPLGNIEAAGRLRMLLGYEDGKLVMVMLEFLPDEPVAQRKPFRSWSNLRFPESSCYLSKSRNEPWWIHFHGLWVAETQPSPTLEPNNYLLCRAVLNNHEDWVEAILKHQPRIEVLPGTEKTITQTALGMAMKNTGMLCDGACFASVCAGSDRDNFGQDEDPDTWAPRAERIAQRLKAAGAIDYSFLLVVCRLGEFDEVEAYLKAGFPPNFSIYGHTNALCEAVESGNEKVCDLLLSYGANPDLPRLFDTSMVFGGEIYPLSLAIEHPRIFKRLLEAGANPNIQRDDPEKSPILMANKFNSRAHAAEIFSMVEFASIRGIFGRNGLFYLNEKNLKRCQEFIPTELLDEPDIRGTTPLLHAISFEEHGLVERLLQMGADPTQPGMIWEDEVNRVLFRKVDTGRLATQWLTPVQVALQVGSLDLVEYLIDRGASPSRYSWQVHVPNIGSADEFQTLRQRMKEDLSETDRGRSDSLLQINSAFPDERARICERLLAILMSRNPSLTALNYPEFIQQVDLVAWAEEKQLHPALIEPFRSGQKLGKVGWLVAVEESIRDLKFAADAFAKALQSPPDERQAPKEVTGIPMLNIRMESMDDENGPDTYLLLAPLRDAEQALLAASHRITGKRPKSLHLSFKAQEFASADFNGGTARACRDAETKGEVGFDDFVEALSENLSPGSTLDHGKLLQSVRSMIPKLQQAHARLKRRL